MEDQPRDFTVVAKEAVWVTLSRLLSGGSVDDPEWKSLDPIGRLSGEFGGEAAREWQEVDSSGLSAFECARHVLQYTATRYGQFIAHETLLAAALAARLMQLTGETAEKVIDGAFDNLPDLPTLPKADRE